MEETLVNDPIDANPETSSDTHKSDTSFDLLKTDSYEVSKRLEKEVALEELKEETMEEVEPKLEIPKDDLKSIFEIANNNVREATTIFNKNLELKKKLTVEKKEVERLRAEHEEKCREEIRKVKAYKEEVYQKLKEKKQILEKEIQSLKSAQTSFNLEKSKFEFYKKNEMSKIQKQVEERTQELDARQAFLEDREMELQQRMNKLEVGENQLESNRLKYESDKTELSNNLLKFNELVGEFTSNVEKIS